MRLIDADALAKAFREASKTDDSENNRTWWSEALISAAEEVDDAPTVDAVERKRGKWVLHPEVRNIYGGIYIECSECHTKYVVQYVEDEKYCRNCGAEMERGEANEREQIQMDTGM